MNRQVCIDGKIRTDPRFPVGFMDVLTLVKSKERFRVLFDTKGRYILNKIDSLTEKYKLCKVIKKYIGLKKVPTITTHDGRTIRYPDPIIKANDTIKLNLETGKIEEVFSFEIGNLVMITRGRNCGRVGVLVHRERHLGGFDIIHVKDASGNTFATRLSSAFVIGAHESAVSLPPGQGIKLSIIEEKELASNKLK